jgi:hypothetical protein
MAHLFRIITLVIVLTATSADIVGSDVSSAGSSVVQSVSNAEPLTDDEEAVVDWAMDRFAQAGLELPELTVRFDPSGELCRYNEGLYHHAPNGERFVTICTRDYDTSASELWRRRTLLHELGHAWDFANMSAEDHDELGQILGADAWDDDDDRWADRGIERFAEMFVFALLDQPRRQLLVGLDCFDVLSALRTATGAEPLGPGLPYCAA